MDVPVKLRRSAHLSWFAHMGAVYLFHDLYGYLMEMSPDIADLVEAFAGGADTHATIDRFGGRFGDADPKQFVEVLAAHAVLVPPDEDELEGLWAFVPIKGKWNVWQRRDDRLVIWTAWGERPIQELFLDADETRMWDAFDGDKRLVELRGKFDHDKLLALVRRLVHSDVQALKLSMMPWSVYAKRPGLAPRYLASTMPYAPWKPGEPVPPPALLTDYYRHGIADAHEQFDHQETTLSHLFRVPHPALAGRTYGQALVDALVARGAVPPGRVRVLEIGAGLGYVARDAIARLRAAGRDVDYTIVELAPTLAAAQRERLGDSAKWIEGDALAVALPDAAFDLVICNEMVGDLPARQLSRADLGLALDGTGTATPALVREISAVAADTGVNLDDAPEPFHLQTGAFQLVARIARALAPGGCAIVTEFGDVSAWPRLSTHLDHPELSTHFGHLQQVARGSGLQANVEFVIDLVDLDRTQQGLATTRSHFRALRALAADAGVDLPKIGYTRELLEQQVAGKLDLATVGDLRYERIEDRLMGLVPHEFKALVATKPR
ncbi:MAG TPA: SAM-dependent methyltransferase [Kofleriaceae bacterium]|nr:SAM-dependent methyltransferase [Kofleriaceae bacterium]